MKQVKTETLVINNKYIKWGKCSSCEDICYVFPYVINGKNVSVCSDICENRLISEERS